MIVLVVVGRRVDGAICRLHDSRAEREKGNKNYV